MIFSKLFGASSKKQMGKASSGELLKQATKLKSEGNLDEAVDLVVKAHESAVNEGVILSSGAYLKLPQYLLAANRNDEAWGVLNSMLANGVTGKRPDREMIFVEHSQVYAEMAKQLKTENKLIDAAIYSILSTVNWQKGMVEQGREDRAEVNTEALIGKVEKLLKGQNRESKQEFLTVAIDALEKLGHIEPLQVIKDLKASFNKS